MNNDWVRVHHDIFVDKQRSSACGGMCWVLIIRAVVSALGLQMCSSGRFTLLVASTGISSYRTKYIRIIV